MSSLAKYLTVGAIALSWTQGYANDDLWYSRAYGGANFYVEKLKDEVEIEGNKKDTALQTGFIAGGAVGLHYTSYLRAEVDFSYRENRFSPFTVDNVKNRQGVTYDSVNYSGKLRQNHFMANAILDWFGMKSFTPYTGIGAGYFTSKVTATAEAVIDGQGQSMTFEMPSDSGATGQGIVGLRLTPIENAQLGIEYRGLVSSGSIFEQNSFALHCGISF